ncbi:MAG: cupin domain-containing protein [Streptosporangiales bacterium]|nr:cupin domain-containing protein [Streptosporangiales bacterium]
MTSFYEKWLNYWDEAQQEKSSARRKLDIEEVEWVETPQDAAVGLLIAPETGFRTWGSETMLAEIPVGWKTGGHSHGEEAIYIVSGAGFSIVDGVRYDWKEGSSLAIPFGARHQHFNTGDVPVRYYSAMSVHLEHWVGVHRTTQYETCGKFTSLPSAEKSANGLSPDGKRVALNIEDAYIRVGGEGGGAAQPQEAPRFEGDKPLVVGDISGMERFMHTHKHEIREFMRVGRDTNGFEVHQMEISGILTDAPRTRGGKHAHMEAHLFIVDGEGYSEVDGEKIPWKPGTSVHIQGPQTVHQHFNESDQYSKMLRIAPGIRYFFERCAKSTFPYLYYDVRQS